MYRVAPRAQAHSGIPAGQEPEVFRVRASEALVIAGDTSGPGSALEQCGGAVGRLAAHAGVHVLVDGECDGGAGVAQAL
jgi:hypothetical protein